MGGRRPWASCVRLEAIEVNRSGSCVESCRGAYSVDIVGESLHYSIRAGPGAMKFGRSPWRRVGRMEHHLIARLEGGAMCLSVVGVGLMALGPAEMVASNFLRKASLLYEICNELRGLACGLWN